MDNDSKHKNPVITQRHHPDTQDGSNTWHGPNHDDIESVWEGKDPISYPVVDRFGQHFIVWFFKKAGMIIHPHKHNYTHGSMLIQGTVLVTGDEERGDGAKLTAPDTLFFPAGTEHSIKALTDNVLMVHTYPPGFSPEEAAM